MRYGERDGGALCRRRVLARGARAVLAVCAAGAICAGLEACSSDPSWPVIGKISDLSNVLTPEERQKALQDLQKNDPNRTADANAEQQAKPAP